MKTNRSISTASERGVRRLGVGIVALASGTAMLLSPLAAGAQSLDDEITPIEEVAAVEEETTTTVVTEETTPESTPESTPETTAAPATTEAPTTTAGGEVTTTTVAVSGAGVVTKSAKGKVTITQTNTPNDQLCALEFAALQREVVSTIDVFKVIIKAPAKPCSPIPAKAVVYKMPSADLAWPQTLDDSLDFAIVEAGTTEVTFSKEDCVPVQFDIVTGAAPAVISPLGDFHGPLLFVGDTDTSQQWTACSTAVLPQTTIKAAPAAATPAVLQGTANRAAGLAVTGPMSAPFALMGGGLVLVGLALVVSSRKRVLQ